MIYNWFQIIQRISGHLWWVVVSLLILLTGMGCRGVMEGRMEPGQGVVSPSPQPSLRQEDAPRASVPGIYFLHDQTTVSGAMEDGDCAYLAEHVAGEESASGSQGALIGNTDRGGRVGGDWVGGKSGAVLELAERSRALGGNVVLLPHFSEEFSAGLLTGRVYRCDGAARRALHTQGASEQRLTVVD